MFRIYFQRANRVKVIANFPKILFSEKLCRMKSNVNRLCINSVISFFNTICSSCFSITQQCQIACDKETWRSTTCITLLLLLEMT